MPKKRIKKAKKLAFPKLFEKRVPAVKKKESALSIKVISTRIFGGLVDKYKDYFRSLKEPFNSAGLDMMFRTYLSLMFLIASLTFVLSFIFTAIFMIVFKISLLYFILGLIIFPCLLTALIFLYMYLFPTMQSNKRMVSIETNLPFAINHMAAVAESGATPYSMFKVLAQFKEYGGISKEAERIVRNMDVFGLDETAALREVISKSPSKPFTEFMEGLLTLMQTGGSLKKYLREESKEAMFNYRMNRDRYNQMIAIYADFYTALLIAAPLIMIAILAILNMIGGTVFGLPIDLIIKLGVYVLIPLLNFMFLMFLQMTQPTM